MKLTDQQLSDILRRYGYDFSRCSAVMSGYRNSSHLVETNNGEKLNFILYKNEPEIVGRIERLNDLGLFLAEKGLPVRRPVSKRLLALKGASVTRYGSLYEYLDGETIPWEAYTKKHIKLLGMALGKFHDASVPYSGRLPLVTDEYDVIIERMQKYFADGAVQEAMLEKLGLTLRSGWFQQFKILMTEASVLSDQLPLHMDMVRSNALFREAQSGDGLVVDDVALSGILDLEKASLGHVFFDIARTLAFLLVDCPKLPTKIYKYLLDSGYQKRSGRSLKPVQLTNGDMLEQLITLFLTYDFYKFLKQNPYESLHENHHYIRTVGILRERQVVQ